MSRDTRCLDVFFEAISAALAGPLQDVPVTPDDVLAALLALAEGFADRVGADVELGLAISLVGRVGVERSIELVHKVAAGLCDERPS